MNRVVVTGGSGFIGSFFVERLAREGHEVVIMDIARPEFALLPNMVYFNGDVRYTDDLQKALRGATEVYDCAGMLGTSELMDTNARSVDVNIRGAVNVLETAHRFGVERIFHPTKPFPGLDDILAGRGYDCSWLNTYSITKHAAELFCLMYQKTYPDMNVTVLRWSNCTGPRQHLYPVRKMIPLFIAAAMRGKPITVYGDGLQTIDMIDVEDVAKYGIMATRKLGRVPMVLDFAAGRQITVLECARKIVDLLESKSKVKFLPMRPGECLHTKIEMNCMALEQALGVKFELSEVDAILEKTILYYASLPPSEINRALRHFEVE